VSKEILAKITSTKFKSIIFALQALRAGGHLVTARQNFCFFFGVDCQPNGFPESEDHHLGCEFISHLIHYLEAHLFFQDSALRPENQKFIELSFVGLRVDLTGHV
jgi:hypothetical protein